MLGKTISHYRILEKLGEGGMGVVYKAEDTKLKRLVALKFLPPELTRDAESKARFIQEAQAASALDHPNICTIYEVGGTEEGQTFIAMAYYGGEDLKTRIERGPLKLDEALDIAAQIAQGLAKAHSQEIVHRDIKPANILVTQDGLVKIVDFGLAKLAGAKLTKTGRTLGTAQYMSPEQARGEAFDHRTDIWSLGIVLYEMITGAHAFPGEYEQATLYAIMNEEPSPVTALRAGVPLELERIVGKCLQKDPRERYQSAADLIADLLHLEKTIGAGKQSRRLRPPPATGAARGARAWYLVASIILLAAIVAIVYVRMQPRRPSTAPSSIAVLAFTDMSPGKDQGYFCDGMTEAIINRLGNIEELKVPARTSVFAFKEKEHDIREIGRKLQVQTVLEGSVQKSGNRLRITAQLINVADGYHLWSQVYDREVKDVFAIQDEISSAIVTALKLSVTREERQKLSEAPIDNVAAYECYLKARDYIWQFSESSLDSAIQYLENGIAIVGDNALLYSALAQAYWQYVNIGVGQEDDIARAEGYAEKALALDPNFSMAHEVLASIHKDFLGNPQEAIRHYTMALAADSNELDALQKLAYSYIVTMGRPAAAEPLMARASQIGPLDPWKYLAAGMKDFYAGQYDLALESYRAFYQADSTNPLAQFCYVLALVRGDGRARAFSIIDEAAKTTPDNVCTKFSLLLKYGVLKERDNAFREMTSDFQRTCKRDPEWSYYVALALAVLDARKEALDWLENAVNRGFLNYPALAREPFLQNLRGEERFKELLDRARKEWENYEV
jgi:serine/threonine protein kinase/Tfp pilus assembly protein PilF